MNTQTMDINEILIKAKSHSEKMSKKYDRKMLAKKAITYSDVSIIPTILSSNISRNDVNLNEDFLTIYGYRVSKFPAFGASMSFMRHNFAKTMENNGAIHILPRVGLTKEERILDATDIDCAGIALGFSDIEDTDTIVDILDLSNINFLSVDVAHGASSRMIQAMYKLRYEFNIKSGLIVGNVGSVAGAAYLVKAAQLMQFEHIIIKVGIGPGAACTTRVNTGVGVAQLSVLQAVNAFLDENQHWGTWVQVIADGGVTSSGDFVKALALADGVMMGKALVSLECEGVRKEDDSLYDSLSKNYVLKYYGMASEDAKDSNRYVEGGAQYIHLSEKDTLNNKIQSLKDGLASAMTYVDSQTLSEFRSKVNFSYNSYGAVRESGVH